MTAEQALQHYREHGTFYMDDKGYKALYKMIKRQAKQIYQAKYATTEACVMCDKRVPDTAQPRYDCKNCHVKKLIEMINREADK